MNRETNWAGNLHYGASAVLYPRSEREAQEIIATTPRVRALGSRHSFSSLADTTGVLLSLRDLAKSVQIDSTTNTARVSASMTYAEVARELDRAGWALHNTASLPHITIAGACATATHGSGVTNRCLSAAVRAMSVIDSGGELRRVAPEIDADAFAATQAGLGGMGVITSITLDVEATYQVAQQVYLDLSFESFFASPDDILSSAYSVSLFTDFRSPRFTQVWRKARLSDGEPVRWPDQWFGAIRSECDVHPVPGAPAAATTPQGGAPGPWFERLPHFRPDRVPSLGEELQSEYLVPRAQASEAIRSLLDISPEISSALLISEVRTVARDEVWLSPAFDRDAVALHFTWRPDDAAVAPVLGLIEHRLAEFDARPHWGKVHRFSPAQLARAYPRLKSYLAQRRRFDPDGVFSNEFLDDLETGTAGSSPHRDQADRDAP